MRPHSRNSSALFTLSSVTLSILLCVLILCGLSLASGTPGTGSVAISGSERSVWDCSGSSPQQPTRSDSPALPPPNCVRVYDSGSVSITVNGFTQGAWYNQYSTASSIASAIVNAFNGAQNSPVSATLSGSTVILTAKTNGSNTNYPLSTSVVWQSDYFSSPSFSGTPSGPTLTGGTDPTPAATPTFSPAPGTYGPAQTVTISDSTPGATIHYTTDGSTPTTNSPQYSVPLTVSVTTTLKAMATASGYSNSAVATGIYTINGPAATPTFSPVPGAFGPAQTVTIYDATPGATIYYTTDGSTPTTGSTQYTVPLTISVTTTLKAIAAAPGYSNSQVGMGVYTINGAAATPSFSPAPGTYGSAQSVAISDATPGATIYYTLDGSTPTTSSTQFSGPFVVNVTTTVKALAAAAGYDNSSVASATYTIGPIITAISPTSGVTGTVVTITGTGFGGTQGNSTVTLNGTAGTPTSWSATSITVAVPTNATTGNVVVTVNGLSSNGLAFTVLPRPSISSITPSSAGVGQSVTIAGANFGAVQGTSTVTFNGVATAPTFWSDTAIIAAVPTGATSGSVVITVSGIASGGASFQVSQSTGPSIETTLPASGPIGISVTIKGSNFGASPGSVRFTDYLNNVTEITPSAADWTDQAITVSVPVIPAGAATVAVVAGQPSNPAPFAVRPTITGLSLPKGPVGMGLVITGTSFGSTQGMTTIALGSTNMVVVPGTWTDTRVMVQVPVGAATGNIVVTVNGQSSTGWAFEVDPAFGCQ